MPKQFFTNTEACKILRCSESTLLRRLKDKHPISAAPPNWTAPAVDI